MARIISIFNNKGGVGKTTYLYHIAHLLAKRGRTVLLVDCDSQSNLTAYMMDDKDIERAWESTRGNSIYRAIEKVYRGIGDIGGRSPTVPKPAQYPSLHMVPGDLLLSDFEDALGDSWVGARGGSEPNLRVQSALNRYIRWAGDKIGADVIFVDLGPNLGALNRSVLGSSDYFIVPVAPDLFSIRGTENLGSKLATWREEWDQANNSWRGEGLDLPEGRPTFLGYVVQQHNIRQNAAGMTQGWAIFGEQLPGAVQTNIVDVLRPLGQVAEWPDGDYNLGKIPNLHSLIAYSLEARKPVFDCTSTDGLKGDHINKARESGSHFAGMVDRIEEVIARDTAAA